MSQYLEFLFVTLSYLLYHQFCEKRTLQSCKCYKGTLVLRITPGHWIIWQIICGYSKTEHRILIGNIMIFQNNFKQLWSDFRKVFKWTCHLMKWITIDHEMCSLKCTGIQTIHKWLISRSGPSYNLQSNNDYFCSAILVISMVYST